MSDLRNATNFISSIWWLWWWQWWWQWWWWQSWWCVIAESGHRVSPNCLAASVSSYFWPQSLKIHNTTQCLPKNTQHNTSINVRCMRQNILFLFMPHKIKKECKMMHRVLNIDIRQNIRPSETPHLADEPQNRFYFPRFRLVTNSWPISSAKSTRKE